jgi:hypothetical protein
VLTTVNFPFICSNIPAAPAYGIYISQLMRYSKVCGSYQDFLDRGLLLTRKLLHQGFLLVKLKSSLRETYGRHHDLVDCYGISVSQMTMEEFEDIKGVIRMCISKKNTMTKRKSTKGQTTICKTYI